MPGKILGAPGVFVTGTRMQYLLAQIVSRAGQSADSLDRHLLARGGWASRLPARPKDPEPAQTLAVLAILASVIGGLAMVWPAFRQSAGTLVQIAVLHFKTGMRG